jgi:predicted DsbA family dithiol-disulfide isomerase
MKTLKIDFVSDVACPWCAVGLNALERALERVGPELTTELHFQPFELNPTMPAEGADTVQYLSNKYGITAEQIARN